MPCSENPGAGGRTSACNTFSKTSPENPKMNASLKGNRCSKQKAKCPGSWVVDGRRDREPPAEWRVTASLPVGYPSQGAENPMASLPI